MSAYVPVCVVLAVILHSVVVALIRAAQFGIAPHLWTRRGTQARVSHRAGLGHALAGKLALRARRSLGRPEAEVARLARRAFLGAAPVVTRLS